MWRLAPAKDILQAVVIDKEGLQAAMQLVAVAVVSYQ